MAAIAFKSCSRTKGARSSPSTNASAVGDLRHLGEPPHGELYWRLPTLPRAGATPSDLPQAEGAPSSSSVGRVSGITITNNKNPQAPAPERLNNAI
jgi:hypothetical protein